MTKEDAITTAQTKFREYMAKGEIGEQGNSRKFGFVWRAREGRFDLYSIDLDQWHVTVSDNGAAIESCLDCTGR